MYKRAADYIERYVVYAGWAQGNGSWFEYEEFDTLPEAEAFYGSIDIESRWEAEYRAGVGYPDSYPNDMFKKIELCGFECDPEFGTCEFFGEIGTIAEQVYGWDEHGRKYASRKAADMDEGPDVWYNVYVHRVLMYEVGERYCEMEVGEPYDIVYMEPDKDAAYAAFIDAVYGHPMDYEITHTPYGLDTIEFDEIIFEEYNELHYEADILNVERLIPDWLEAEIQRAQVAYWHYLDYEDGEDTDFKIRER